MKSKGTPLKTGPVVGPITRCQICNTTALKPLFAIGHQPPVHGHLTKNGLQEPELMYPLAVVRCPSCLLVQLTYAVPPEIIFDLDYPYHSGTTDMLVRNFRQLADEASKRYDLKKGDLVIDLGSNDGTLLQGFKDKEMRVLGVEPTNVAKFANKINKVPTLQKFFTNKLGREIVKKYGKAKVVTATNVFAHINNVHDFLRGIKTLLRPDGVFISESQYLLDIVGNLEIDTFYDEHLRYYSIKPMQRLFASGGFTLVHAQRIRAAGGSIRVYAEPGKRSVDRSVREIVKAETTARIYEDDTFHQFIERARKVAFVVCKLLAERKLAGDRIAGLGAPGRGNTLLNFMKINHHHLDYLGERSSSPKIGLYSPGTHIPIVDEARIIKEQPETLLVLSWHIADELIPMMRKRGYKGQFLVPLPEARLI